MWKPSATRTNCAVIRTSSIATHAALDDFGDAEFAADLAMSPPLP
jgi:hypothetical protein